jgi:hypothetical protein
MTSLRETFRRPALDLTRRHDRLSALFAAGIVAIFGYLLIYHLHHQVAEKGHLGDFPTFYKAAQLARDHGDIYDANQHGKQPYIYPPLTAVLYIPLTYLPIVSAARIMLLITVAMLIAAMVLGAREMLRRLGNKVNLTMVLAVVLCVAGLNEDQLRAVTTMLETDALMLLLFTLALRWLDDKPMRAGAALAFAFNIKYLSIVTLPYLLLRRRWTAAATMIIGSIIFGLLPALHLGWHENLRCLQVSTAGLLTWVGGAPRAMHAVTLFKVTDGLSFSLTSGIARVLRTHNVPAGALAPVVGSIVLCVFAFATLVYRRNGFALWRGPDSKSNSSWPNRALTGIEWTLIIAAILSFSPQTNARHLVLGVMINTSIMSLFLVSRSNADRCLLFAALMIILFSAFGITRHWTDRADYYGLPGAGILIGSLIFLDVAVREVRQRRGTIY